MRGKRENTEKAFRLVINSGRKRKLTRHEARTVTGRSEVVQKAMFRMSILPHLKAQHYHTPEEGSSRFLQIVGVDLSIWMTS